MIAFIAAYLSVFAQQPEPPAPACTPANATRTTVAEIAGNPRRFIGRCVTVTAPSSGRALFQDIDALYLGTFPAPFNGADGARGRIGLYPRDNRDPLLVMAHRGPLQLTVTGLVDTCEDSVARARAAFERRHEPDMIFIPFMSGYCHWFAGPMIKDATYVVDETARYERLTGEAARRRVGELVAAAPNSPGYAALHAFANEFETAVRTGDRASLIALHDMDGNRLSDNDRRVLVYLLDDANSPFAMLRTRQSIAPVLFVRRDASVERDGGPSGVICFCRSADCSDRWPISRGDAGNGPERPYACTVLVPRDWRPRRAGLDTPTSPGWLPEPARTSYRQPTR